MPPARGHIIDTAEQCQVEARVSRAAAVAGKLPRYEKAKARAGTPPTHQPCCHYSHCHCSQAQEEPMAAEKQHLENRTLSALLSCRFSARN